MLKLFTKFESVTHNSTTGHRANRCDTIDEATRTTITSFAIVVWRHSRFHVIVFHYHFFGAFIMCLVKLRYVRSVWKGPFIKFTITIIVQTPVLNLLCSICFQGRWNLFWTVNISKSKICIEINFNYINLHKNVYKKHITTIGSS